MDWSVAFIFALIAMNLGAGLLPALHPAWGPALRWGVAFGAAVLFLVSILLHELSHAVVARAYGMKVGGITLFMFGGLAQVESEPQSPAAEFWMALVGPLTSLLIGVGAVMAGTWLGADALMAATDRGELAGSVSQLGPVATLLLWLGPINVVLALFNLLPGFPLDGGRVLRALLWWATNDLLRATRWAALVGRGLAGLLIALGISMALGVTVPVLGGGLFQGLWLVLIGWFLHSAARAAHTQVVLQQGVGDVPVAQLMDTRVETVPPDVSVASLVHERLLHSEQRCFPVADGGTLEGLVCLDDIRRVPSQQWEATTVRSVMTPASHLTTVSPEERAARAMELLAHKDVDQLPVVDQGRLLRGLIRRRDVVRWVELRRGR